MFLDEGIRYFKNHPENFKLSQLLESKDSQLNTIKVTKILKTEKPKNIRKGFQKRWSL